MEEQAIRFTSYRGRRIAWTRTGSGPPLVLSGWWMSHLELNWRDPSFRAFVDALGRHRTVIRYDAPGTGASADGAPPTADVDEEAAALAAVVEAAAAGPVDLAAGSSGAPIGIAYAVARPERVRRLLVYGGYASGSKIADARSRQAIVDLVRDHWGLGSRALADVFMPSATAAEREGFVDFQRQASDAEGAARALEAVYRFDVADRVDQIAPGAVVLHRRQDRAIPSACGRELASGLPEATFVALDGDEHFPWRGDTDQYLDAALEALGVVERDAGRRRATGDLGAGERMGRRPEPEPGTLRATVGAREDALARPGVAAPDLTARETEVLALIASGLSDREIADRLVLSPHTVHRHVANVRTKLGLPTRAAAVAAAARRGLL